MGFYSERFKLVCKIRKGIFEDVIFNMRYKVWGGVMGSLGRGNRYVKIRGLERMWFI